FLVVLAERPCPPLLPSTTLFRSCGDRRRARLRPDPGGAVRPTDASARCLPTGAPEAAEAAQLAAFRTACGRAWGAGRLRGRQRADRKSTRLNSSHVKTSYAGFCL